MENSTPDLDRQFQDLLDDDEDEGVVVSPPKVIDIQVPTPSKAAEKPSGSKFSLNVAPPTVKPPAPTSTSKPVASPKQAPVATVNKPQPVAVSRKKTVKASGPARRKTLYKRDLEFLLFLGKTDYCTTRQLAIAFSEVGDEDNIRRRLRSLEVSGYTESRKRPGAKTLWMITAKAVAKLKKEGTIPADSRLKNREASSITPAKVVHTLAVAQVMAWLLQKSKDNASAFLSERELKSHHALMKLEASRRMPQLYQQDEPEAVFSMYRDLETLAKREDLSPQEAANQGGFSFEAEQSPEEVLPALFRPMERHEGTPYGQSPDFVVVKHRYEAGLPPRSTAVEVELHSKSVKAYEQILGAYRDNPLIGRVVFFVTHEEARTYTRKGEVKPTERLEDRILAVAKSLGMDAQVSVDYIKDNMGNYFSGDAWSL